MIPEKFKGQVIVDVAGLVILITTLIIYYSYTKPCEDRIKK